MQKLLRLRLYGFSVTEIECSVEPNLMSFKSITEMKVKVHIGNLRVFKYKLKIVILIKQPNNTACIKVVSSFAAALTAAFILSCQTVTLFYCNVANAASTLYLVFNSIYVSYS